MERITGKESATKKKWVVYYSSFSNAADQDFLGARILSVYYGVKYELRLLNR